MFISSEKSLEIWKMSFLVTIMVGQSYAVFLSLLSKNNQILSNDGSFSSLKNVKRLRRLKLFNP